MGVLIRFTDTYPIYNGNKNKDRSKYVLLTVILLIINIALNGCYTQQKAQQQIDKANEKYPSLVAVLARDKYPCTEILKPDTSVIYKDSLIYVDVECPDTTENKNPFITEIRDTINNIVYKTKTVRVPVNVPVKYSYVTRYYEDSAKLKLNAISINKLSKDNETLSSENKTLTKKVANKSKENWLWRIIAICLMVWQGIKLWKNLTTIKMKSV